MMELNARFNAPEDPVLWKMMLEEACEKVRRGLDTFVTEFPHVSDASCVYPKEDNRFWTASFWVGMVLMAYEATGDAAYLRHADAYLDSFEQRLDKGVHITHDVGFLYTLTARALWLIRGDERSKRLMEKAQASLAGRFNEPGGYFQAWNQMGVTYPDVKIIIDTMLNLPLMYNSEKPEHREMARRHAETSARTLMRPDRSSFHIYLMRPETGEAVSGHTHQGFHDDTTWARGQAWAVYGYALSYRHTKEQEFLAVAQQAAEIFIQNLPDDFVPYWDFAFSDTVPDIRDSSAASIFTCGLLELCQWSDAKTAERYRQVARQVVRGLYEKYVVHDLDKTVLIKDGMYHRVNFTGGGVIWGDYFFMETLMRLAKPEWRVYW